MIDTDHSAFREDSHIEFSCDFICNHFKKESEENFNNKNLVDKLKKSKIGKDSDYKVIRDEFNLKKVVSNREIKKEIKEIEQKKNIDDLKKTFLMKEVVSDKEIKINKIETDKITEKIKNKTDKNENPEKK